MHKVLGSVLASPEKSTIIRRQTQLSGSVDGNKQEMVEAELIVNI
jgi:hypothetical protein